MAGQILPQIQKEALDVVGAGAVAGAQPKAGHHPHFAQHSQEWMQARLGPDPRVAYFHPFLMSVLVQQSGGIQIQSVASRTAGQAIQTPAEQSSKTTQI